MLEFANNQIGMQELGSVNYMYGKLSIMQVSSVSDPSGLGSFFSFCIVSAFYFQYVPSFYCSVSFHKAKIIMECEEGSSTDYLIL